MEYNISLAISLISDTIFSIIYTTFYSSIMNFRIKKWQYILIMVLAFSIFSPLQYIFSIPHAVTYISGILLNWCGILIFSKEKLLKKTIYMLIPYITDMVASSIYMFVKLHLTPDYRPSFGVQFIPSGLEAAIFLFQSALLLFIISLILRHKKPKISNFTAIYVLSILIIQMYTATFMMYMYWTKVSYPIFCTVIIAYIFAFSGIVFAVLYYNNLMNKKEMKQDMIEKQYQFMNTQYEQLRSSYITYKKLRHDIKDHLMVINGLAMKGETEELQAYTNTLAKNWEDLSQKTFCDVPAIDIILVDKYNTATTLGVKTDFVISGIKEVNVDNVYLSAIFANLLNNAIEASSNCEREACISLHSKILMEQLVIVCKNDIPKHAPKKADTQNHGYGLHIIGDFAKLLDGTFTYENDGNIFTAVVTIPVKKGAKNK